GHRGTSILEAYQQVAQTGESRVTEAMYQGESIPDPTWFRIAVVSMGVDIAILAQDITDRKRAEEALLKAKEELEDRVRERTSKLKEASLYARSLIEASLDPLVTISPEGKITDVNEATAKVTGVPRDQLIGSDFSDYFTEPGKAREGYQQVFKKGFVTDYPLTIRNSAGNLVDVLYNASLYRDILGNVLGVFAAARDVTEPKRVMREFAETKNFLDNILESSTKYSIIGEDFDHRILSWNEGARRNYGYTAEEIIGQNSNILHVQEDVKMGIVDRLFETAYERGLAEGEFQRVRKDGSRFIASLVVTRRNDAYGNPIGYLLISSDISEKKQAEEQIRQAAQYARSLIEASVDPLVTISTDGKITDVNRASEQVTGISRLQLIGSDFSDYFTEPERARVGYEKVFRDGFVRDYPLELKHRDGLVTPVLYNASVYRDETGGRILGVFAAARDITKRKEMEKEMLAVHRKLRAMTSEIVLAEERSRQRLAADLHDTVVQTIGAVKLRSQLIQDQIPRKARPIFTELQDMLTQSIAQARLIMAEMSPPVLYELGLIPAVEWLAEQIEDQHGIAIKFERENSIEPLEHEIKVLLFQATRELLMNIVKHAKSEGAVVKVSGNTDRVRIEVIDNGIGLDKKQAFRTDLSSGGFGLFSIRERLRHIGG
ncbi:MAG: PAS domain-containing sensor histidine kinase, partial [Methanobacteriota archaeon]